MASEPSQTNKERIQRMRVLMLQTATHQRPHDDGGEYADLWTALKQEGALARAPEIVKAARTLSEFDSSIRPIGGYSDRRDTIEKAILEWLKSLDQRGSRPASSSLEKYTLHELIGDGGFAHVYAATDNELGRKVAIKVFKPGNTDFSSALSHARALARVSHANIVTILEFTTIRHPVESDERSALVMEFLSGPELVNVLKGPPLEKAQAWTLCTGILSGLREIHNAGLIHADLHDENIKLDKHGTPKVLDILYRGTLASKPMEAREEFVGGDLHRASSLLRQILVHALLGDEAEEFRRLAATAKNVDDLAGALTRALRASTENREPRPSILSTTAGKDGASSQDNGVGGTQPLLGERELSEWFDDSLRTFEAEEAEYRQRSGRDLFGRGALFSAYQFGRPTSSTIPLPTLRDQLEGARYAGETQFYPFLCRLDRARMTKKGSCIQSWIDIGTVPAATFMRASTHGQVFVASTLFEDFVRRYSGRFVLDPHESLVVMVRGIEHARRVASQQSFVGTVHIVFRYRGLLNRELVMWSRMVGLLAPRGIASEDQVTVRCSFDTDGSVLSASDVLNIIRSPLDDVLMNFDLCAIGRAGMPDQESFETVAERVLRGEDE